MAFLCLKSALVSSSFESTFSVVSLPSLFNIIWSTFVFCRAAAVSNCGDSSCDVAAVASFSSFALGQEEKVDANGTDVHAHDREVAMKPNLRVRSRKNLLQIRAKAR